MKKAFVLLLLVLPLLLLAQVTLGQGKAGIADVADEDPGLFIFTLILFLLFTGVVIAAFVITLLLVAMGMLLVFSGILSASIITAWYHKSFSKGAALLVFLCAAFTGGAFGLLTCLLIIPHFFPDFSIGLAIILFVVIGMLAGFIVAKLCLKAGQLIIQTAIAKSKRFLKPL